MARTLLAGVDGILAGGPCYWLAIISPNTGDPYADGTAFVDTSTPIAFGSVVTYALAGYTYYANRLTKISEIDNSINIFSSALAAVSDVKVTIQNKDDSFNPFHYVGRELTLRFGHGASMSIATSDVFFTGRISSAVEHGRDILFTARGKSETRDKEMGTSLPENVDNKFKGKIYPIVYGNWTDDHAYVPTVLNRPIEKLPDVIIDLNALVDFKDLRVWDSTAKIGYRAKMSEDAVIIDANENKVSMIEDTGDDLNQSLSDTEMELVSDGTDLYDAFSIAYGSKSLIIKVGSGEELMLVVEVEKVDGDTHTRAVIERGYMGTLPETYSIGESVYTYSDDLASFNILVSSIFWASGVSGMREAYYPTNLASAFTTIITDKIFRLPYAGSYEELLDEFSSTFAKFKGYINGSGVEVDNTKEPRLGFSFKTNILFNKIGVEGTVQNAYMILKAYQEITYTPDPFYASAEFFWVYVSASNSVRAGIIYTNNGSSFTVAKYYSYPVLQLTTNRGDSGINNGKGNGGAGWILMERTAGANDPDTGSPFTYAGDPPPFGASSITFTQAKKQYGIFNLLLFRTDDNTYQIINSQSLTYPTVTDNDSIDNVDDVTKETDYELIGSVKPADVSDLNDGAYALSADGGIPLRCRLDCDLHLYRVGIRCDFYVSPIKFDFYARVEGRKNPGGYFNGNLNDLIENPSSVIEDLCRTEVLDMSASDLYEGSVGNKDGFDWLYSERSSWKLAYVIYSE